MECIVKQDEQASYSLAFSLEVNVGDDLDLSTEHTHCLKGSVLCETGDEDRTEIGQLHLYWFQLDELMENGVPPYDAFDAINCTTEA